MGLLIIKIYYFEIILTRLEAAPSGFQMVFRRNCRAWDICIKRFDKNLVILTIRNNKKKHC